MSFSASFHLLNDKKRIPVSTPGLLSLVQRIHRSVVNPAEKVNSLKMISIFKIGDGIDFRLANDDQVHVYIVIYIYNYKQCSYCTS